MTTRGTGRVQYAWVILGGTALALLAASGVRSACGVFIKPMETEFGWDRTSLSLVASLSFLVGSLAGGYFYDRFGSYAVAFHSAALVAFAATLPR